MQLDKKLIKNNFKKSFLTYENNATAQKETARKLISFLKERNFNNVLEIGSYSGYLTKLAIENINCVNYSAIDIIEESEFAVKNINPKIKFYNCDFESFQSNTKYDLILSNASLQWCEDLKKTISKIKSHLAPNGILAISIFQENNLFEIKDSFGVSLKYPSIKTIKKMFSPKAEIVEVNRQLEFDNSFEILRHLKLTGVNSLRKNELSYKKIKEGLKILEEKYKNKITYKSVIIID